MKTLSRQYPVIFASLLCLGIGDARSVAVEFLDAPRESPLTVPVASDPAMVLAFDMSRIIGTQTDLIRHSATEAQRKAALASAKAYLSRLPREKKFAVKQESVRYLAVPVPRSEKTSPKAKAVVMIVKVQPVAKKVPAMKSKNTAEEKTPKSPEKSAGEEFYAGSLINNEAYELPITPTAGTTQKFDTITAQYIEPYDLDRRKQ